jgi:ligand-binding SRPBCC domain-containing protein
MRTCRVTSEIVLAAPRDQVFAFFSDAANLEALTPDLLRFRILTPAPVEMRRGARIDYRLRVRGVPVRWRSEVTHWLPPWRFVDRQLRGPYRLWVHEHEFEERDGATVCRDRVTWSAPGGPIVARWLVAPDLERIFAYRRAELARRFGEVEDAKRSGRPPAEP